MQPDRRLTGRVFIHAQARRLPVRHQAHSVQAGAAHQLHHLIGRMRDHPAPVAGELDRRGRQGRLRWVGRHGRLASWPIPRVGRAAGDQAGGGGRNEAAAGGHWRHQRHVNPAHARPNPGWVKSPLDAHRFERSGRGDFKVTRHDDRPRFRMHAQGFGRAVACCSVRRICLEFGAEYNRVHRPAGGRTTVHHIDSHSSALAIVARGRRSRRAVAFATASLAALWPGISAADTLLGVAIRMASSEQPRVAVRTGQAARHR